MVQCMWRTLKARGAQLRRRTNTDPAETGRWLGQLVGGWYDGFVAGTRCRQVARVERGVKWAWMIVRGEGRKETGTGGSGWTG